MLINYNDAYGHNIQLEVSDDVGNFYLASIEAEKNNDRRNTRRHTSLSEFTFEEVCFFDSGIDVCGEVAFSEAVKFAISKLSERQQYLFTKIYIEGWRFTELAAAEGRDESTIRKAALKAKEKFVKFFAPNYPK
jgi:RNA polymerase sigma-70 factor (ECF subfamily)